MTESKLRTARGAAAVLVAAGLLSACAGTGGEWGPAPAPGTSNPAPAPGTSRPAPPTGPGPDRPAAALVISQNGLPGMELSREVLDVSTSDLEDALGDADFVLVGQTERCGLAINEGIRIAAVTNDDLAVVAYVVERPDAATREGIRRGSSTDDIVAAYGRDAVFVRDVPSRTGGPLVWVTDLENPGRQPDASSLHYAFDTDSGGRVTRIRAGFWPHVAHVDHCSDDAGRARTRTAWPLS